MPDLTLLRPVVALVAAAGLVVGCRASTPSPAEPTPSPSASATTSAPPVADEPAAPVSITIPSIDVDGALIDLGLAPSGELEGADDADDIGWFTGGGRPGGPGPTVVVGHLDSRTGPAVFARLGDLDDGDSITVTDAEGGRHDYRVTDSRRVPQDPFPTEDVFGRTVDDEVRLITCTGPYDRAEGRYTENLLVTAERI